MWSNDSVLVWTDHQISKDALNGPDAWHGTEYGMITHILDGWRIPHRLE